MQIDRRITNGLAWAGLVVIVAIPVADAVSAQMVGERDTIALASIKGNGEIAVPVRAQPTLPAPVIKPVVKPVAALAPVKPIVSATPVADFLATGKALPSYITAGDAASAQTVPTPTHPAIPAPVAIKPVEVAKIAPVPMPLSMRPFSVAPNQTQNQTQNQTIVIPPEIVANGDRSPMVVDNLEDWETGPLSEFLAQRHSSASLTRDRAVYDDERPRQPRRDIYLGPVEDGSVFFPFTN